MKPRQFRFGEIHPQSCSSDEAHRHLHAFVEAFIAKHFRDRWLHILIEKPQKAKRELVKFERHLDARYCKLDDGESLMEVYGKLGVYFDGTEPPFKVTGDAACNIQAEKMIDAIFSIVSGKLAWFLFHEGWCWKCEKQTN